MKRAISLVLVALLAAVGLIVSSCDEAGSGGSGYTVSGTLYHYSASDGTKAYAKLVQAGGSEYSQALYFASATFVDGEARYSVSGIAGGTYNVYCFVDLDGNAPGDSSSAPDSGDDYVYEEYIVIDSDIPGNDVYNWEWYTYY